MSYGDYVAQLTYLLFLKMADERTQQVYNQTGIVPKQHSWFRLVIQNKSQDATGDDSI